MTTEATPLVAAPSYALGMVRAKLRLVRNPETDELFAFMGLFAPHQAFVVLGQGTAVHVKVIGYCIYVAVAATLLSCTVVLFPLDPERDLEAGTAGAWLVLTYGHVLFDMCLVALFGAFIHFIALLLLNPSALERHTWLRQLAAAEARLRANIVDAESNFEKQLASWSSAREDETARAVERIASLALSGVTPHVPKEMASEKKSMLSIRPVLEDAVFVEACSVVVKGWGRGTPLPSQIYGAVVAAAGAEPAYAVQPTACVAYDEAHSEVATARLKLDKAVAAAQLNGGSSHDDGAVVVSARRADLDAATSSEEAALTKCKGELLDYAFLTFQVRATPMYLPASPRISPHLPASTAFSDRRRALPRLADERAEERGAPCSARRHALKSRRAERLHRRRAQPSDRPSCAQPSRCDLAIARSDRLGACVQPPHLYVLNDHNGHLLLGRHGNGAHPRRPPSVQLAIWGARRPAHRG